MAEPRWAIVVLNWNGRDDTLACLRSLAALPDQDVDVIVVDNGSSDDSVQAIRAAHPGVELVETGANLGFAGGNNAGIERALERGAAWVVLLNNDAVLDPGAIAALRRAADSHPEAGVLGGKLYFADPPGLIWFAGQRFNPLFGYSGRPYGYRKHDAPEFREPREIGRAVGALMAVPRVVIDEVGALDESLFLYVEDVEWCLRVKDAGYTVRLVPDATAVHQVSASTGGEHGSLHAMYYGVRNTIVVCERHRPLAAPLRWLRRGFIFATFMAQALVFSEKRGDAVSAVRDGFSDARSGNTGPRG